MSNTLLATAIAVMMSIATGPQDAATTWRADPAWHAGKAEWALYDAVRPIYGRDRSYEATIFTNKQRMDPVTTVKADDWKQPDVVEVFKHNLSEIIQTENYDYRFLTTCFVQTETLAPWKIVFSSQEDCGSTYKQFVVDGGMVRAEQFCYFPGGGREPTNYGTVDALAFHDTLSLTLRDYPFDADEKPELALNLVPDQTDTHETPLMPEEAIVRYVGKETVVVPYGAIRAHHLVVEHAEHGGRATTDFWFAADRAMRHVMVKYDGPFGVHYELKRLEWWAYWKEPRPKAQPEFPAP